VRDLVRVGADEVVVGDADLLAEGADGEQEQAGDRRGERIGDCAQQAVHQRDEQRQQHQVGPHQRRQRGTEQVEHQRVEVRGERPVEPGHVPVEHGALRESPGHVQLAAEVDQHVGPAAPRPARQGNEDRGDQRRAQPGEDARVDGHLARVVGEGRGSAVRHGHQRGSSFPM